MTRQEFIINNLKPYFLDPSTCGYENGACKYKTKDGRMCVFGKNLVKYHKSWENLSSYELIDGYGESILTEEAAAQNLSSDQWQAIQEVHDQLATNPNLTKRRIEFLEIECEVDLTELKELL